MQIGVHAQVFTGTLDEAGLRTAIEGAKAAGYDLLEVPLMNPVTFDSALTKRMLDDAGLAASASLGLTEATDLSSEDDSIVAAGEELLERVIDRLAEIGGRDLCGVIHSAMRKHEGPATERGRANSQAALGRLGAYGQERGVRLSLEVVNRYESNLFNTARGARDFLAGVGHENVGIHLDTYHMNIEESDNWQPILDTATQLNYAHVGESHRGYLGTGSIEYGPFFRALERIGFDGPVVFESFSSAVVSAELSNTLAVWRNLWNDSADLAAHANRFIRDSMLAVRTIALH